MVLMGTLVMVVRPWSSFLVAQEKLESTYWVTNRLSRPFSRKSSMPLTRLMTRSIMEANWPRMAVLPEPSSP